MLRSNCPESYKEFLNSYFFSTYRRVGLEFFLTVNSETIHLRKKVPSSFRKHELSILISCLSELAQWIAFHTSAFHVYDHEFDRTNYGEADTKSFDWK